MNDLLRTWDAWVLQRSPVVWQLRLHRFVPLALLLLGLWALALLWLANPARWLGALGEQDFSSYRTPERRALELLTIIAVVLGLLQALWWLASTRVHNRWRDHLPAGRWALWREWLWGALLCALLLAPLLLQSRSYTALIEQRWQGTVVDVRAQKVWREQVQMLEHIVAPENAVFLPHWDAVADLPATTEKMTATDGLAASLMAVRLLKHGQVEPIAQFIEAHARLLQAQGYVAADGGSPRTQAQALVQTYRAQVQQHQADWQAELVRQAHSRAGSSAHQGVVEGAAQDAPTHAQVAASAAEAAAASDAAAVAAAAAMGEAATLDARLPKPLQAAHDTLERCRLHQWMDRTNWEPRANCLKALATLPESMRLDFLRQQTARVPRAQFAKWVHPRYGQAIYPFEASHLERLQAPDPAPDPCWLWGTDLIQWLGVALLCALVLLAVRLLSWGQIALLGASLVVTFMLGVLLGATGVRERWLLAALGLPLLGIGLWRVWRGRPWGSFVWLGCGLAVALMLWAQLLWSLIDRVWDQPRSGRPDWAALLSWSGYILGVLLLLALLTPVLRRWRSLAER